MEDMPQRRRPRLCLLTMVWQSGENLGFQRRDRCVQPPSAAGFVPVSQSHLLTQSTDPATATSQYSRSCCRQGGTVDGSQWWWGFILSDPPANADRVPKGGSQKSGKCRPCSALLGTPASLPFSDRRWQVLPWGEGGLVRSPWLNCSDTFPWAGVKARPRLALQTCLWPPGDTNLGRRRRWR